MKEITVEGYKVTLEETVGGFVVSVPKLPGCTIQVADEREIRPKIRGVIGEYLELRTKKPCLKKSDDIRQPKKDGGQDKLKR